MRSAALACLLVAGCSKPDLPSEPPDLAEPSDPAEPSDLAEARDLRSFRRVDVNHVLSTGQSLSVGAAGSPALSTSQPYRNLMFNVGAIAGGANLTSFVPLVERGVETLSSGMANLAAKLAQEEVFPGYPEGDHAILVSCHGMGGTAYSGLKKGTTPYENGLKQARAAQAIAESAGLSYVVRAVTNVHGESDHVARNLRYADDLLTWQADYEADLQALTGQAEPVPMLHTQMSSWTKYNAAQSPIPGAQLTASLRRPERLILVGPKYFLPYAPDGVHLTNEGYRWLGEHYAKVYRRVVLEGRPWSPLRPLRAERDGAVIHVTFHVPEPPLVFDTQRVTDPGRLGFEFSDGTPQPPAIVKVELAGPTAVKLTLSRAAAPNGRLRYAFTGVSGNNAGPSTGPRGNLRDSDRTASRYGYDLSNWCVHFEIGVP